MYYAGIGSRETPSEVISYFEQLGRFFAVKGLILRSGGAKGSDQAFERGCDKVHGNKEIYLPWKGFEDSDSELVVNIAMVSEIAKQYHPLWNSLKQGAKKLHGRNVHQVLGANLQSPSNFIVCYTKDGSGQGGTGQAIRISKGFNVPVFDCGRYETIETIKTELKAFLIANKIFEESELTR